MHILLRGGPLQRLRVASGLVLFLFAATHFLNHALGLFSLDAMQAGQDLRAVVTRSIPGTIILVLALFAHMGLGLHKLAGRATLRLPPWELTQVVLGLAIPFMLFPHIVNTRVANWGFGVHDTYLYELARLWPASSIYQSVFLLIVWTHGCMGLHYWMRLYAPYRASLPLLRFFAIAIPLAALGGFMMQGRFVQAMLANPETASHIRQITNWPNAADNVALADYRMAVRVLFGAVLGLLATYALRRHYQLRARPHVLIRYAGGPVVETPRGPTLLEISRMHAIPHASVCGGRARCSTCRVRIDDGQTSLADPKLPEAVTLAMIGAPRNVRLACQIHPRGTLSVTRLLPPTKTGPKATDLLETDGAGVEKPLAVMFLDLRDFTELSSRRLPYDVVFILNEFFAAAGRAIETHGGWIDKFLGDGLLAVFGQHVGMETGARQVLRAARAIDIALDQVNARLSGEIGQLLRIGIGVHTGNLLLGRIGYGDSIALTVIGNAVNVASRLEALTKQYGMQIIISSDLAKLAGSLGEDATEFTVEVRGVSAPMQVVGLKRARNIPATILIPTEDETAAKVRRFG